MLTKQALDLPFAKGLDQKKDPYRLPFGNFFSLVNSVFTKEGRLTKRNGFQQLSTVGGAPLALTTFNDNLIAIGTQIQAYSGPTATWINKGQLFPINLSTLPLIRNNYNQTQADVAIAPSGVACVTYTETTGTSTTSYYAIVDSTTGQTLVNPIALTGTTPKVAILQNYFLIITTGLTISYTPVNTTTFVQGSTVTLGTSAVPIPIDITVLNSTAYVAYGVVGAVRMAIITATLATTTAIASSTNNGTALSIAGDATNGHIWVSYWDGGNNTTYFTVFQSNGNVAKSQTTVATAQTNVLNLASVIINSRLTLFEDQSGPQQIASFSISPTYTITANGVNINGVGLASKAFAYNNQSYYLSSFVTPYQPSYFLINGTVSTAAHPVVVGKLAYSNGGGYLANGLPDVSMINGSEFSIPYLSKDLIQAVNKNTNVASGTQTAGVYTQTGISLATWNFNYIPIPAEIGRTLHLSGGMLWDYDGEVAVENNFNYWPEPINTPSTATTGGSITAGTYYYQITYEWQDNQGLIHRSAPSIPTAPVTTTGSTSAITLTIPTLKLTYKPNVKIVIYRWSAAQEIYYQVTSVSTPLINNPANQTVTFVDTSSDATILGNNIIYTTGGVVEDIGPPAFDSITLFDTRLWGIDSEDKNLLWFSKQVIEGTPVEMSDLLTYYVAPTTGAQGSTGDITCLFPMDDKLIIFKSDAMYYINGSGPDNTGINSTYPASALFITSTVGTVNQRSIVLTPQGLMFQSDKGIWLLGRGLDVGYIGANVEDYTTSNLVTSAVTVPGTNQVRFTLNDNETCLVYDYYFQQWNTFTNVDAISATLYQGAHTFMTSRSNVCQELVGSYMDAGGKPVLMSFTTSWVNTAGVQGYQRTYFFYLLGDYYSPHTLQVSVAYDYNPNPTQSTTIQPGNLSPAFGSGLASDPNAYNPFGQGFGGTSNTENAGQAPVFGGPPTTENWRVFLQKQRCQAFQVTVQEVFDPTARLPPGAGLTLTGLNLIVGLKKGYSPIRNAKSVG